MNANSLVVIFVVLAAQIGQGAEPITQLSGARDWQDAALIASEGSGVAIDSISDSQGADVWLHLQFPPGGPWILHLDNPDIRNYEVISMETGEILYHGGLDAGLESRSIFHPDFLQPVQGSWGDEALMRLQTIQGFGVPIGFYSVNEVTRSIAVRFLKDGMFYGVIVLMAVFSIFVSVFNSFGHSRRLGVCLLAWFLTMVTLSGYGNLLLWPGFPSMSERAYPIIASVAGLSTAWFSWHFLKNSAGNSLFLKGVNLCIWFNGAVLLASIWTVLGYLEIIFSMVITGSLIVCAASVSALKGDVASRYLIFSIITGISPFAIILLFPMMKEFMAVSGSISVLFTVVAVMKRLSERTQKQEVEAEVVATRAKFLASMSHEIRTPLNGVIGFSELCAQEDLGSEAEEYMSQIQRSSKLLLNVVNEVLDFSKLEAGAVAILTQGIDLHETIANILETLGPAASASDVSLDVCIEESVATYVVTDSIRFSQILLNLLSNAIKFTKHGTVLVTARQRFGRLELEVKDNGIGIAAESIPSLFDPYRQVTTGTFNALAGTGLGLSIAKQFADLLGGTIDVESTEGKGSLFTLSIPYEEASAPAVSALKQSESVADLSGVSVLVAEDNEVNQVLVRKVLEKRGALVDTAENGKEAMALATASNYDVILMDVQMPGVNGIEATRGLRGRGCKTPIVALTANNSESDKDACVRAGMSDFLSKPFVQSVLVSKIEHWAAAAH